MSSWLRRITADSGRKRLFGSTRKAIGSSNEMLDNVDLTLTAPLVLWRMDLAEGIMGMPCHLPIVTGRKRWPNSNDNASKSAWEAAPRLLPASTKRAG